MLKRYLFITFLFFLVLDCFAQLYSLSGKVVDAQTKEPLAFVNAVINNSRDGVSTDIDGKFQISYHQKIESLRFSCVGYEALLYVIQPSSKEVVIYLKRNTIELSEVVILPGENPAHAIIEKVVENRNLNNPEKRASFSYSSYNKMIFNADFTTPIKDSSSADTLRKNVEKFLADKYFFIMESITERKFKFPDKSYEKVIASRISGFKDPLFAFWVREFQSFSFYNERISITDKNYINPISKGSANKYFFLIEDTLFQGKDTVFVISFHPKKNTNFDGLKGFLSINTNGYAIQNVIAEPAIEEKMFSIKIQQLYQIVDSGYWFPVQLNTDLTLKAATVNNFRIIGQGRTYIKDIQIDQPLRKREFSNVELEILPDVNTQSENVWTAYRVDSLSEKEMNTYKFIDSIGRLAHLDRKVKNIQTIFSGKIPVGFLDFDIYRFIKYNVYEGFRFGLGAHTNNRLSRVFSVGGYAGYGVKDMTTKYGGNASVLLDSHHDFKFSISYVNDLFESGGLQGIDQKNIMSISRFREIFVRNLDKTEEQSASLSFFLLRYLKATISLKQSHKVPVFDYAYGVKQNNVTVLINDFNFTELSLGFRYAYKEKFIVSPYDKISLGSNYPVLSISYTKGLNDLLGGEFNYQRIDARVAASGYLKYIGKPSVELFVGYIDGDVPYSNLYSARAGFNKAYIDIPNAFATMRYGEFLSSQYIAIFFNHSFGKLLIKTKYFHPEIQFATNITFGSLNNKDKHYYVKFNTLEKGYYESGVIINSILDFGIYSLGAGAYYRYGPYSFESTSDNLALKWTLTIPF